MDLKFRAWDGEKMYSVKAICFEGRPVVTLQYNPVIKKPMDTLIIMQYIGVTDKNKREMCEGDKIRYCYHVGTKDTYFEAEIVRYNGVIETGYEHDKTFFCGFVIKGDNGEEYGEDRYYYKEIPNIKDVEIIGNIYEG